MTIRAFLSIHGNDVRCATCHRGGAVSYWCVNCNVWHINQLTINRRSLAALPSDEQARVRRHLARNGVFV